MELRKSLSILGLSTKEERVLIALTEGVSTPLLLARVTKVTRPAVYDILKKLKDRGLVKSNILNGKKSWHLARNEDIDQALYETKKVLLSISDGVEETKGLSDGAIVVHRGSKAILKLFDHITKDHKEERLYTMHGEKVFNGWDTMLGKEKINEFNDDVKKNGILTESIIPEGWFEENIKRIGEEEGLVWIQGFIDRALATYQVDKKYFNHAGQIFMFKSSLYLMSMNEGLVVEIRNSELQRMIKLMFSFIEDHAERIDVNSMLKQRIGKKLNLSRLS
jgi:DNA-binding MarR family transcriptional regulator